MSAAETIEDIKARAQRMYAMALLVETFKTPSCRKQFIVGMYEINAISGNAAEMLIEAFGLEAA